MDILNYKGYEASIKYSAEDEGLVGQLLHINDVITFFGKNHNEILVEFHEAVNSYLAFCKERGVEPNKPYKGSFNIRTSPEVHQSLAKKALKLGLTLNECVNQALRAYLVDGVDKSKKNKPLKHSPTGSIQDVEQDIHNMEVCDAVQETYSHTKSASKQIS